MKKGQDYRSKSPGELDKLIGETKDNLTKAQLAMRSRKLKNTNEAANMRRELARMLSARRERGL